MFACRILYYFICIFVRVKNSDTAGIMYTIIISSPNNRFILIFLNYDTEINLLSSKTLEYLIIIS